MKVVPLPRPFSYRLLEILPATIEWVAIIGLVLLGFFLPIVAATIIILVDVYWLVRVSYLSFFLVSGYFQLRRNLKVNWLQEVKQIKTAHGLAGVNYDNLYHLVLYVIVDEHQVVESTIESLARSVYDLKKVMVVISAEERFYAQTREVLAKVRDKYRERFLDLVLTVHPWGIPGEMVGKGSNETWGAREAQKRFAELKIPLQNVIVEVFDIDTEIYPSYLARVTHAFLTVPDPLRTSYQPVALFMNNAWDAPAIARVIACSTSFWQIMSQGRPEYMETFSSHSMSFKTAVDVDFWSVDSVSEDSLIFWHCFLKFNGNYRVYPLFYPVSLDMVLAGTFWQTLKSQYKQQRRWAWGVEGVPFVMYNFFKNRLIPWRKKIIYGFFLWEGKFSWAITALVIGVLAWIPLISGRAAFENTVFAQSVPLVTRVLSTLAMIGLLCSTIITNVIIKRDPRMVPWHRRIGMWLQWLLLPITTIVFGSIVALDAHTRLLLGKYMGFFNTPKVRKRQAAEVNVD